MRLKFRANGASAHFFTVCLFSRYCEEPVFGARKMAQQLGALTAPVEDPSTHASDSKPSVTLDPEDPMASCVQVGT